MKYYLLKHKKKEEKFAFIFNTQYICKVKIGKGKEREKKEKGKKGKRIVQF
jgi:hypothetical protein